MLEKYNSPSEETTEKQQEAIKENDKAQLETPRRKSTNPIRNKNNVRTTALERSVTETKRGFKIFYCQQIFILDPDVIINTETHKKFSSHNGILFQSMHQERKTQNSYIYHYD